MKTRHCIWTLAVGLIAVLAAVAGRAQQPSAAPGKDAKGKADVVSFVLLQNFMTGARLGFRDWRS